MIKALYFDFDGCLSDELPGALMDLELIKFIREINEKSKQDHKIPFIAINSGRPEPFIEAHCQSFGIKNYSVFENGAGIFKFLPNQVEVVVDPKITPEILDFYHKIHREVFARFEIQKQPGKEFTLTYLFSKADPRISEVSDFIQSIIDTRKIPLYLDVGLNFVNVNVVGVTKGTGLSIAARYENIDLNEIAAIGDSPGDWSSMELAGFSACPNNARSYVKERVDYVSPYDSTKGAIDIIKFIIDKHC